MRLAGLKLRPKAAGRGSCIGRGHRREVRSNACSEVASNQNDSSRRGQTVRQPSIVTVAMKDGPATITARHDVVESQEDKDAATQTPTPKSKRNRRCFFKNGK
jgi:hypothetical protein